MKQQAWTKDGEITIDVVTPLEELQNKLKTTINMEQRLIAIEEYLGVKHDSQM